MSIVYDNWERLVGATLKREQLRLIALADSLDSSFSSTHSDLICDSPIHKFLLGARIGVLEVKAILSSNEWKVEDLLKIEGAPEALMKLIKEPISLTTTKASLSAICQIMEYSSPTFSNKKAYFAEIGLVSALVEMLVDAKRSTCEKVLSILDGICSCRGGMEKACENSLTAPILVKKILCVSELATQLSVSILWKLVKTEKRLGAGMVEALEAGILHRLVVLLQVGCCEITNKKAAELLNLYRKVKPMCAYTHRENPGQ